MTDIKKFVKSYEFETTLPGSGKVVKIKPVTTHELKSLLLYENEKDPIIIEQALDDLIQSCVLTEEFNIKDLYLQDRFFLLIELRKVSKGNKYSFVYTCTSCEQQVYTNLDLNKLKTKNYDLSKVDNKVKLDDQITVEVDHVTRGEQLRANDLVASVENESEKYLDIGLYSYAMAVKKIITTEGEFDSEDIELNDVVYVLTQIPMALDKVKDWFTNNQFGTDFRFTLNCTNPECKHKEKMDIPLDNFFS